MTHTYIHEHVQAALLIDGLYLSSTPNWWQLSRTNTHAHDTHTYTHTHTYTCTGCFVNRRPVPLRHPKLVAAVTPRVFLAATRCNVPAARGNHVSCVGLARTIYIRCVYGIFGRKFTIYTVTHGVYSVYVYGSDQPYTFAFFALFACSAPQCVSSLG